MSKTYGCPDGCSSIFLKRRPRSNPFDMLPGQRHPQTVQAPRLWTCASGQKHAQCRLHLQFKAWRLRGAIRISVSSSIQHARCWNSTSLAQWASARQASFRAQAKFATHKLCHCHVYDWWQPRVLLFVSSLPVYIAGTFLYYAGLH